MKVGFIGMGNMGYAILKGIKENVNNENIIFHQNTLSKMKEISKTENVKYAESNSEVVKKSKYIILAVKPQMFDLIAEEIKDDITSEHIIISMAPGFDIKQLVEKFNTNKIVRTMPNTPAMIGEGVTGICYFDNCLQDDEKNAVISIFESVGKAVVVEEKLMNAVVCASGSSPAYVFMFIEALADSVVKCGMPRQSAYEFVTQTIIGSAKLMVDTGKHPGELKDMVCSPGGTTIAGVQELENNGFRSAIFKATEACFNKCNNIK